MLTNEIVIEVNKLNKYFGEIHAVRDLSLTVKKGEIYGFLGPNGGGKTTTLRMLCGLLTPNSGQGICLGFDILTQSYQIKQLVGYMTQRFSYYEDLTVAENLDFIARIYQLKNKTQKIDKILSQFSFEYRYKQLAGELSGGWKQRLALAACLLHEPQLLLLDEPTAGVDPKARREFWDFIHELSGQGITILVSTHYMDEAERCTRLAYMANGTLLIQGTLAEITTHFPLTTWEVKGKNLHHLASELKQQTNIDQVAMFGDALHVSGKDKIAFMQAIEPYLHKNDYQWNKIKVSLEDIFISLSDEETQTQ